ncbi:MAG: hypothetical protein GY749_02265 [Desulfobacteraceae bacterium]|nr:hypothetical protein [Desulfobacteraceae bacterium]
MKIKPEHKIWKAIRAFGTFSQNDVICLNIAPQRFVKKYINLLTQAGILRKRGESYMFPEKPKPEAPEIVRMEVLKTSGGIYVPGKSEQLADDIVAGSMEQAEQPGKAPGHIIVDGQKWLVVMKRKKYYKLKKTVNRKKREIYIGVAWDREKAEKRRLSGNSYYSSYSVKTMRYHFFPIFCIAY